MELLDYLLSKDLAGTTKVFNFIPYPANRKASQTVFRGELIRNTVAQLFWVSNGVKFLLDDLIRTS